MIEVVWKQAASCSLAGAIIPQNWGSSLLRIDRVSIPVRMLVVNLRLIRGALGRLEEPWADWRCLRLTCEVQG